MCGATRGDLKPNTLSSRRVGENDLTSWENGEESHWLEFFFCRQTHSEKISPQRTPRFGIGARF